MKRVIVKIGSALLVEAGQKENAGALQALVADTISAKKAGVEIVIVSSGAIGYGRDITSGHRNFCLRGAKKQHAQIQEQVLAAIGQPVLMTNYVRAFDKHGYQCAQILVTRSDFADRERYLSLRTVVDSLLASDIIPIFNENDVLSPEELDFHDNDHLACIVAAMLIADKLLILTNVNGVYNRPPAEPGAKLISQVTNVQKLKANVRVGAKSSLGKGGMANKLETAHLASSLGITTVIANGKLPEVIFRVACSDEQIGTTFSPGSRRSPSWAWLATSAAPSGAIIVSTYLADNLKAKRSVSVILVGVEEVVGDFEKGAIIQVLSDTRKILGVGKCRLGSVAIKSAIQERQENGDSGNEGLKGMEVIHYDHLALSP